MSKSHDKLRILIVDSGIDANGECSNYPEFGPSPDCAYPGWCLEIIDVLLRSGNISHEFIVDRRASELADWGRLRDNGSFSGVLGRVQSGDVDMACLLYQKSVLRQAHFDFSIPISEARPTFIIREMPLTFWTLILNCLKPYDANVWLGMLVALIVQMLLWTVIGRVEVIVGMRPRRHNGEYFCWDVFEEMFNGGDHPFYLLSGKMARLTLAVFQKGLLPALYTAFILTALLAPADMAPIRSQSDAALLIESGRYKLIADKSKWFAQDIQFSEFSSLLRAVEIKALKARLAELKNRFSERPAHVGMDALNERLAELKDLIRGQPSQGLVDKLAESMAFTLEWMKSKEKQADHNRAAAARKRKQSANNDGKSTQKKAKSEDVVSFDLCDVSDHEDDDDQPTENHLEQVIDAGSDNEMNDVEASLEVDVTSREQEPDTDSEPTTQDENRSTPSPVQQQEQSRMTNKDRHRSLPRGDSSSSCVFFQILSTTPDFGLTIGSFFQLMNLMDNEAPERLEELLHDTIRIEGGTPMKGGAHALYQKMSKWKKVHNKMVNKTNDSSASPKTPGNDEEVSNDEPAMPARQSLKVRNRRLTLVAARENSIYQKQLGQDLGHVTCIPHELSAEDTAESLIEKHDLNLKDETTNVEYFAVFMVRMNTLLESPESAISQDDYANIIASLAGCENFIIFIYDAYNCYSLDLVINKVKDKRRFEQVPMHVWNSTAYQPSRKSRTQEGSVVAVLSGADRHRTPSDITKLDRSPCQSLEQALIRVGAEAILKKIRYVIQVADRLDGETNI